MKSKRETHLKIKLAEGKGFEPLVPCEITSFQD